MGQLLAASVSPAVIVIYVVVIVLEIASLWRIFEKAGAPGWAAIIPIYNAYVLLKIVGRPGWWLLLFFVPFVNLICEIIVAHDLSKSFGHGAGFTVGLVLLSFIFVPILGFGSDRYLGPAAVGRSPYGYGAGDPSAAYGAGSGAPMGGGWGGGSAPTAGYGYPSTGPASPGYGPVPPATAWEPRPAAPEAAPADWYPDPTGAHQLRYWNGTAWTEHVSDNGVQATDAI